MDLFYPSINMDTRGSARRCGLCSCHARSHPVASMAWEPSTYKKDVSGEMPNAYDPKKVEQCWGEFWEKEGLMGADAEVSANSATAGAALRFRRAH